MNVGIRIDFSLRNKNILESLQYFKNNIAVLYMPGLGSSNAVIAARIERDRQTKAANAAAAAEKAAANAAAAAEKAAANAAAAAEKAAANAAAANAAAAEKAAANAAVPVPEEQVPVEGQMGGRTRRKRKSKRRKTKQNKKNKRKTR